MRKEIELAKQEIEANARYSLGDGTVFIHLHNLEDTLTKLWKAARKK